MTLRWKKFERSARQRINAEIKLSKALRKQRAEARKRRATFTSGRWLMATFVLVMMTGWVTDASGTYAGGGHAFSSVLLFVATFLVASSWVLTFGGTAARLWHSVPISRDDILKLTETTWLPRLLFICAAITAMQTSLYFLNEHQNLFEAIVTGLLQAMIVMAWDPLESTCRHASLSIL